MRKLWSLEQSHLGSSWPSASPSATGTAVERVAVLHRAVVSDAVKQFPGVAGSPEAARDEPRALRCLTLDVGASGTDPPPGSSRGGGTARARARASGSRMDHSGEG